MNDEPIDTSDLTEEKLREAVMFFGCVDPADDMPYPGDVLFAWAVQQARLLAYVSGEWDGPSDDVAQLVVHALRNVA